MVLLTAILNQVRIFTGSLAERSSFLLERSKMTLVHETLMTSSKEYRLMYRNVDYDQYYGRSTLSKYQQANFEYLNQMKKVPRSDQGRTKLLSLSLQDSRSEDEGKELATSHSKQIVFGVVAIMCIALVPSVIALICIGVKTMSP